MKRFTETTKWDDPWYHGLTPAAKLLWEWITNKCDSSGVIDISFSIAAFQIGLPVSAETLEELGRRVEKLPTGKYHVSRFIEFQYGTLSDACPAHKPVFRAIKANGLKYPTNTLTDSLHSRLQEEDKDKDKEREADKTQKPVEDESPVNGVAPAPCTLEQAIAAAAGIMISAEDAQFWWESRAADNWMKGAEGNRRPVGNQWQYDLSAFTTSIRQRRGSHSPPKLKKPPTEGDDWTFTR